jgi:hypothetical protein
MIHVREYLLQKAYRGSRIEGNPRTDPPFPDIREGPVDMIVRLDVARL